MLIENNTQKKCVNGDFVTKQHMFGVFRLLIMKQIYTSVLSLNICHRYKQMLHSRQ